jgi:hypothetical protein
MHAFTVIIPTHDHAETLWFSIASVLAQTVQDFELVVVGDGAPPRTAEIVAAIAERDPRVRYMPNPKGERHGEAFRHEALMTAHSRFVAYQCDDDLWFPDHLETLARLLEHHDLAHTMQIDVTPDGHTDTVMFDAHNAPYDLERMRRNDAGFGLASGGHTMLAYRRLPHGWRPAPKGINSDTYFWLQFLDQPWCRYASHKWPDVVHGAAIPPSWPAARRAAELAGTAARVQDPAWRDELVRRSLVAMHDRVVREMQELAAAVPAQTFSRNAVYSAGARLTFSRSGNAYRYRVAGTYPPEAWGAWLRGTMRIVLPRRAADRREAGDATMTLELVHLLGAPAREVSRVRVAVNDRTVAEIEERIGGPRCYEIAIPAAVIGQVPKLVVEVEGLEPATPRSIGLNDDRELSAGIIALSISSGGAASA